METTNDGLPMGGNPTGMDYTPPRSTPDSNNDPAMDYRDRRPSLSPMGSDRGEQMTSRPFVEACSEWVSQRPMTAIGLAFGMGWMFGSTRR